MEIPASIALANSTILNLRKLLVNLRAGLPTQAQELEIVLSRSITDLAGLLDHVAMLENELKILNEKNSSI